MLCNSDDNLLSRQILSILQGFLNFVRLHFQEYRLQLERLRQERSRWSVTSQKAAAVFHEQCGDMSKQEVDTYMSQVAKSCSQQNAVLTKAIGLKLQRM